MQAVDRLHRCRGVLEWRLRERALRDVDQKPHPVRDVLVESRLELQAQRREEPVLIQVLGRAVNDEQRSARGNERAKSRDELEHAVGPLGLGDEYMRPDHGDDARVSRSDDARSLGIDGRWRAGVGIPAVEELARVVTDEFDQRRYAQRLTDVVYVDHQGGDTRQHEEVRRRHGDARNLPCAIAPIQNLADRQHGVHEGRDEEPDRELAGFVAKDPLHDPGRELPHRQLNHDHRDRQHERREAHHRDRDRAQDHVRRGRHDRRAPAGSPDSRRRGRGRSCRRRSPRPRGHT